MTLLGKVRSEQRTMTRLSIEEIVNAICKNTFPPRNQRPIQFHQQTCGLKLTVPLTLSEITPREISSSIRISSFSSAEFSIEILLYRCWIFVFDGESDECRMITMCLCKRKRLRWIQAVCKVAFGDPATKPLQQNSLTVSTKRSLVSDPSLYPS